MGRPRAYRGKRAFDLVVTALLAVPAAVVGAVCAFAVRLTSSGPVIFRQERVGLGGEPFTVYKFRTMYHGGHNPVHPDADRITPAGKVLRRLSLDELPQLVNVLRGDMSIVGPRPTLAYQVARYDERQRGRLATRPGLTGLAQVRERNVATWPERIELDLEYIRRQSLGLDARLLIQSVASIFVGSGVEGHPVDDPIARVDEP